ncbi:hypothetical protein QN277_024790 [Acacia crassicarpa]|uniref:RPA-interacting protein n=1 Tax=Acacia crassicarpa TaxID=499986 RepID=A0AAE1JCY8_9FABA|nr:hypothetical protein QN277_024790 [Acacia crassicarpa]
MENRQDTVSSPSKRPSLKSGSHFNKYNIWKDKLREGCYKRVREDRTRLLWKMRLPASQPCKKDQEDMVRSAFQDIVYDELKKMKESSLSNALKDPTSDYEFDDLLWEYDGVHTYQGECEDILLEMQRIFYEDLKAEPNIEAIDCTSKTCEDEDEFLARVLFEHMKLNADETYRQELWCPICKKGELKESRDLIYCTHCELRLSKANELTLDFLRDRLAEAHTEHLDNGCRLKPKFCLKTRFNLTALYISCEGCDTFEIII